jgi:hypothetical protein
MFRDARLPERFWAKVSVDPETGCWLWIAGLYWDGYGKFSVQRQHRRAHRVAYEALVGLIPDGLVVDHVRERGCASRACVNPSHLELVTQQTNVARGDAASVTRARFRRITHCPKGHPYEGDNLYQRSGGRRICRACAREASSRYRESRR